MPASPPSPGRPSWLGTDGGDRAPPSGSFQVCSPGQAAWVLGTGAHLIAQAKHPRPIALLAFVEHILACSLPAWLPGAVLVGPCQTP